MKIAMIGTGYVGLVSGICFSDFGHEVICVDKDPHKIELLNAGKVPIYEPGLATLMQKNVTAGRLSFSQDLGLQSRGLMRHLLPWVRRHGAVMVMRICNM